MILLKVCSAASLLGEGFMNQVTSTNKASLSLLCLTMKVALLISSVLDGNEAIVHHNLNRPCQVWGFCRELPLSDLTAIAQENGTVIPLSAEYT